MNNFSQTQLANYAIMLGGLLAMVLSLFGIVADKDRLTFIIFAVINLGAGAYSFYQRYMRGDLTLGGFRR